MSHRLTGEVWEFLRSAPDVTPAERLVLLTIADKAQERDRPNWPARQCRISPADMAAAVGVASGSLGKVYLRLARKGLDVRVPIGRELNSGRMVYSGPGNAVRFELPELDGYHATRLVGLSSDQPPPEWSDESPTITT